MTKKATKKLLEKIAKENNITIEEVKKEIEHAISQTYKNPTPAALAVPRKNDIPTIEEFLEYMLSDLK